MAAQLEERERRERRERCIRVAASNGPDGQGEQVGQPRFTDGTSWMDGWIFFLK